MRRIIESLISGFILSLALKILDKYGGIFIMKEIYQTFIVGLWPWWIGLAVAIIYWFTRFSINVYRTYINYERDKKAITDKVNKYQEAAISLGNQFTKTDNKLDEIEAFLRTKYREKNSL
jgi:hypothetical protein